MKIDNHYLLFCLACLFFIVACSEENERIPIITDPTVPGVVSNIRIESLPGAVQLTYDIPDDQNLSYIRAECMINGINREVKSSIYQNKLTIAGFADSSAYIVRLYSVSRSEIESEPVIVEVKPLNPPFREVFENISLVSGWGGASVTYENPAETDLAISLIYIDSTGYWNSGVTTYTKRKQGSFAIRGFEPEETVFGVYIRDRWGNATDTLVENLIPRYEIELDRTNFRAIMLPSDEPDAWGWIMPNLWDGLTVDADIPGGFHTDVTGVWPQHFTFDLGVETGVKLSRFKYWQRSMGLAVPYNDRNIRKFELWGSMNPNPNGEFDESWTLLLEGESIKPSGLPLGELSDEDIEALYAGEEFEFPIDVPVVRYIRMRVTETWARLTSFYIMEVAFFGAEQNDDEIGKY